MFRLLVLSCLVEGAHDAQGNRFVDREVIHCVRRFGVLATFAVNIETVNSGITFTATAMMADNSTALLLPFSQLSQLALRFLVKVSNF